MSEFYDEMNGKSPTYRLHRKETYIWAGMFALVIFLAYLFVWQLKQGATNQIDTKFRQESAKVQPGSKAAKQIQDYENAARTDPVGFGLTNFVGVNYSKIVFATYVVLAGLSLAVLGRFVVFLLITSKRNKYYPTDEELETFLADKPKNWDEFYAKVKTLRGHGTAFWKVLRQSSTVINESKKYDHLYLHMRNRMDSVLENINQTAIYDAIATASPAAGFFGNLVGLLHVFSISTAAVSSMYASPEFMVGLKIAITSSLWGLVNLGGAILFSTLTRQISESIYDRMILKSFAVCSLVERFNEGERDSVQATHRGELTHVGA